MQRKKYQPPTITSVSSTQEELGMCMSGTQAASSTWQQCQNGGTPAVSGNCGSGQGATVSGDFINGCSTGYEAKGGSGMECIGCKTGWCAFDSSGGCLSQGSTPGNGKIYCQNGTGAGGACNDGGGFA